MHTLLNKLSYYIEISDESVNFVNTHFLGSNMIYGVWPCTAKYDVKLCTVLALLFSRSFSQLHRFVCLHWQLSHKQKQLLQLLEWLSGKQVKHQQQKRTQD